MKSDPKIVSSPTSWISDWIPLRDKIVLSLSSVADQLAGHTATMLRHLADEIAFAKQESDILKNPLALEIFLTLAGKQVVDATPDVLGESTVTPGERGTRDPVDNAPSGGETGLNEEIHVSVEHAVNRVLQVHGAVQAAKQRLYTVIAYPLVILVVGGIILVLTTKLLVPTFEAMFDEFGLELPAQTHLLFAIADLTRSPWTYAGVVLFLLSVGFYLRLKYAPRMRSDDSSAATCSIHRQGSYLRSTRVVCGDWAWHTSLLMRAGLGKPDAIEIAGESSGRDWLRQGSRAWAMQIRDGRNPFIHITHFNGVPCQLLADTLAMETGATTSMSDDTGETPLLLDQPGALRDIAEIYWDRVQPQFSRLLGCWSQVFFACVVGAVGFIVTALFAPLIQLITALS